MSKCCEGQNVDLKNEAPAILVGAVSGKSSIKHQLEYSIYSARVSWCPVCLSHFYNERNNIHTTKPTSEHYHLLDYCAAKS